MHECAHVVLLLVMAMSPAVPLRAAPKAQPDVVIHEGTYPGWPWICRTSAGALLCVFREGTEHDFSAQGRVMLSRSDDLGKTWSRAEVIIDAEGVDDRNTALAEFAPGRLMLTYNTYTSDRASQAMYAISSDNGRTWSLPKPLDRDNTRTKAAVVALRGGRLVLPYYAAPGNGALAGLSDDGGRNWKTVQVPDAPGFLGDEWDLLEVAPNRLVGVIRNSHPQQDGAFWQTTSQDAGQTWSIPSRIAPRSLRAASPAQLAWHNQTPVLVYADRRMVSVSIARARDPLGLDWDVAGKRTAYHYEPDESPILDGSYPVSVQIDQRTRLVVDYEIRPNNRRIAGYFVEIPERW